MPSFELPELKETEQGNIRRVGFELEYAGVDLEKSTEILSRLIGSDPVTEDSFRYSIESDELGEFIVEIDADLLQGSKYKEYIAALGLEIENLSFEDKLDEAIKDISSTVIPCEIVTPPLPMDNMQIIEDIVYQLRKEKAKGTRESLLYAFGLHINPELVSNEPDYLLHHIQAFALLYDWICNESEVDLARKLTPFINPYPDAYIKKILAAGYQPDLNTLIDDYLELVKSRNHALDMLPALACINEQGVFKRASDPHLIKPRPAFHYRLANCLIDQPDWKVADEWQYWLKVELLADDQDLLNSLCKDYLSLQVDSLFKSTSDWISHVSGKVG